MTSSHYGRHHTGRHNLGRPDFPYARVAQGELAVAISNHPTPGMLMINGDHDGVMYELSRRDLEQLVTKAEEALHLLATADDDPSPVEQWEVTEGVTARERHELAMRVVRDAGRVA